MTQIAGGYVMLLYQNLYLTLQFHNGHGVRSICPAVASPVDCIQNVLVN